MGLTLCFNKKFNRRTLSFSYTWDYTECVICSAFAIVWIIYCNEWCFSLKQCKQKRNSSESEQKVFIFFTVTWLAFLIAISTTSSDDTHRSFQRNFVVLSFSHCTIHTCIRKRKKETWVMIQFDMKQIRLCNDRNKKKTISSRFIRRWIHIRMNLLKLFS